MLPAQTGAPPFFRKFRVNRLVTILMRGSEKHNVLRAPRSDQDGKIWCDKQSPERDNT